MDQGAIDWATYHAGEGDRPVGYHGESGGGSSGGGGETETDKYLRGIVDGYQKQLQQYNSKFNEYTAKNPFVFDTVLQQETAKVKQRLDPYYNQVLGDYLQGAEVKKARSLQDERTLVSKLNQDTATYNQDQKEILKNNLDSIDQQTGGESGFAKRAEGNTTADTQTSLARYNTDQANTINQTQIAGQRERGYDIPLAEQTQKRDVTEEQAYQTQAQALTQTQQQQNQYQFARQEYAGNPAGVDPNSYQNNLYSILGQ